MTPQDFSSTTVTIAFAYFFLIIIGQTGKKSRRRRRGCYTVDNLLLLNQF